MTERMDRLRAEAARQGVEIRPSKAIQGGWEIVSKDGRILAGHELAWKGLTVNDVELWLSLFDDETPIPSGGSITLGYITIIDIDEEPEQQE